MANRTCSIEGCSRAHRARGFCASHYTLAHRRGDFIPGGIQYSDPEEAFRARTERDSSTGCLVWVGARQSDGYGRLYVAGRLMRAHRYAWERENGSIPSGMLVDHSCHRRDCVEEGHLRLATIAENGQNRSGAVPGSATGVRNVYPRRGGFYAVVARGKSRRRSPVFPTIEEAARAAEKLRADLFGEFAGRG